MGCTVRSEFFWFVVMIISLLGWHGISQDGMYHIVVFVLSYVVTHFLYVIRAYFLW